MALRWFLDSFNKHQLIIASFSMCFCMFLPCVSPFLKIYHRFFFLVSIFHRPMLHFRRFFDSPFSTCWTHLLAKMAGQTPEVQLIDFGRSASKAALTGPCGEAFRAGHVSRWLPLRGLAGLPAPGKRWARFWDFTGNCGSKWCGYFCF